MMDKVLKVLQDTPVPTLLIFVGWFLIILSFVDRIGGIVEVGANRNRWASLFCYLAHLARRYVGEDVALEVHHPNSIGELRATVVIPFVSTAEPYKTRRRRRKATQKRGGSASSVCHPLSRRRGGARTEMSRSPQAARPARWRISSVYVRRRDGPKRIEQAYRILIDGKEANPEKRGSRG